MVFLIYQGGCVMYYSHQTCRNSLKYTNMHLFFFFLCIFLFCEFQSSKRNIFVKLDASSQWNAVITFPFRKISFITCIGL